MWDAQADPLMSSVRVTLSRLRRRLGDPAAITTAAGLAWWWSGRAVGPIERVRTVAEDIEASDLGRRIALTHGPSEVVALADAFDAVLERLEHAADAQRRLVVETSQELRTPLAAIARHVAVAHGGDVAVRSPAPSGRGAEFTLTVRR